MTSQSQAESLLPLSLLNRRFVVDCPPRRARQVLERVYALSREPAEPGADAVRVRVREPVEDHFVVDSSEESIEVDNLASLVWAVGAQLYPPNQVS